MDSSKETETIKTMISHSPKINVLISCIHFTMGQGISACKELLTQVNPLTFMEILVRAIALPSKREHCSWATRFFF